MPRGVTGCAGKASGGKAVAFEPISPRGESDVQLARGEDATCSELRRRGFSPWYDPLRTPRTESACITFSAFPAMEPTAQNSKRG